MTTQEKYEFLIKNWGEMSIKGLADHLGVSYRVVSNMAVQCRKNGIKLAILKRGKPGIEWDQLKKLVK